MSDTPLSRFALPDNPSPTDSDSRTIFFSSQFQQNWTELTYGIESRKGLMLLTGDAGTGKSVLVGRLATWSQQRQSPSAVISGPALGIGHILDTILPSFGVACSPGMKSNKLFCLNQWLLARYRAGKLPLLIIEDAHCLSPRVLEQVRMLLNFETPREKLLQILLVGRPELEDKLKAPTLRQFRQRIALRCKTSSFSAEETAAYIEHQLRAAGSTRCIFAPEALAKLHAHSRGIARAANSLCRDALAIAVANNSSVVSEADVVEAARKTQPQLAASPNEPNAQLSNGLNSAALASLRQALSPSFDKRKRESHSPQSAQTLPPSAALGPVLATQRGGERQSLYPAVANLHTAPPRPLSARSTPIPKAPTPTPAEAPVATPPVAAPPTVGPAVRTVAAATNRASPKAFNLPRTAARRTKYAAIVAESHYRAQRCAAFLRGHVERTPATLRAALESLDPTLRAWRTQIWPRIRAEMRSAVAGATSHPSVRAALGWIDAPLRGSRFTALAMKSRAFLHDQALAAIRYPRLDAVKVALPAAAMKLYSRLRCTLTRIGTQAATHPKTRALQRWLLEPLDSPRHRRYRARPYGPAARPAYSRRIGSAQTGSRP